MSGVFGVVDPDSAVLLDQRLRDMGRVMTHRDWYVVEHYVDTQAHMGVGRIGIGIFNPKPQPVWNQEHTVAVVMAGEFYSVERSADESDEALALRLYQSKGKRFAADLQGAYILAIWDTRQQQLILINDHFGLYPTYIAQVGSRLIFAPEVKGVLQDTDVDRSLRQDSVAEYIRFQRLLGQTTFFAGVNMLPPASILTYDYRSQTCEIEQYWSYHDIPLQPGPTNLDEAVEEGSRLLRAAVTKLNKPHEKIGVYISGGLDSRGILGMLPRNGKPLHTFTFGRPECRDIFYARQIAQAAHVQHHPHYFHDGNWIKDHFDLHMNLTEGFQPWMHMHGISMLPEVRQSVDVNISGLGDLIWTQGSFTPPSLLNAPDETAFADILYELYVQKYNWPGITEAEEHTLYQPAYYHQIQGVAFDDFARSLEPYTTLPAAQRAFAFNTVNHFSRHLQYHVIFGRSHVEYRLPYFDLELQAFCYNLPQKFGANRRLQREIIAHEFPELALIPVDSSELPISNRYGARTIAQITHKFKHTINDHVKTIFPEHPTLYADYEGWLRTDLRGWAEDILMSEQTLSRGIFQRKGLRSLLDRHNSGQEMWTIGKIAPIISFEMMLRHFGV